MKFESGYIADINIAEMQSVDDVNIKIDQTLIDAIVAANNDSDPMFVTIEVIREGVSRNNRNYTREAVLQMADQINANRLDGYRGHLSEEERKTKAPEAQTMWLGAETKEVDGVLRLYAKGYVLPYAQSFRTYLKTAKAAKKNVPVSIFGYAKKAFRDRKGITIIKDMLLQSIDWARPGSEGVPNKSSFVLASEMLDDSKLKKGESIVDREEVLKDVKADELKKVNPELVSEMVDEAVQAKEAELETANVAVAEMTSVSEVLGMEEGSEKKPSELVAEMVTENLKLKLDGELRDKVKNTEARKIVRSMLDDDVAPGVNVSEMVDSLLASDEGKSIIRESVTQAPQIAPRVDRESVKARKFTKVKK